MQLSLAGLATQAQRDALTHLRAPGSILLSYGAFWTTNLVLAASPCIDGEPSWYIESTTWRAMLELGWIEPLGVAPKDYYDHYRITEAGRSVLAVSRPTLL